LAQELACQITAVNEAGVAHALPSDERPPLVVCVFFDFYRRFFDVKDWVWHRVAVLAGADDIRRSVEEFGGGEPGVHRILRQEDFLV